MSDAAELTSLASSVEDFQRRVAAMAARYEQPQRDEVLAALYEAERALRTAERRLQSAARLAR